MATVSGQGTTFNLPNYTGELFQVSPYETPFVSSIGGLTGGKSANATKFQWQVESLESTSANNSRVEGADAPAASEQSRSNVENVVEIHQESVEVSYTKQAAVGQLSGLNVEGSNPVRDELDHQVQLKLRKMAVDIEKSFLSGTKVDPSDNTTARATQGILGAITTNVSTLTAGSSVTKADIDDLLVTMFSNGGLQNEGSTVFIVSAASKVTLTGIYSAAGLAQPPMSRNVGGVNINQLVTDFGTFGVMVDRWMPADTYAVVDLSVCAPVFLNIPNKGHLFVEPLAKTGAADSYQLYGEVGLEYGPEQYHGKLSIAAA